MKKESLLGILLMLILVIVTFVTLPMVQTVYADGNIQGKADLKLVSNLPPETSSPKCSPRCLLLSYRINSLNPASPLSVTVGLHQDSCKGNLKEGLEQNNIPVGDGADSRQIRASVSLPSIPLPEQRKWFFCVFRVEGKINKIVAKGLFDVKKDDRLNAHADVASASS